MAEITQMKAPMQLKMRRRALRARTERSIFGPGLRTGDDKEVQDAAVELRAQLRQYPGQLAGLFERLLDPSTSIQEFANLALVAGSLGNSQATNQI